MTAALPTEAVSKPVEVWFGKTRHGLASKAR